MGNTYLSLFSGVGGADLACQHHLLWRCLGYVEWDQFCQRVLSDRMQDGLLNEAPLYGDIEAFISEGYAQEYQGLVDVIFAGFPCQSYSTANALGFVEDNPKNKWPTTKKAISLISPPTVVLENVLGLLGVHGYWNTVVSDLESMGYAVRWTAISALFSGAPQVRQRLFAIAQRTAGEDPGGRALVGPTSELGG